LLTFEDGETVEAAISAGRSAEATMGDGSSASSLQDTQRVVFMTPAVKRNGRAALTLYFGDRAANPPPSTPLGFFFHEPISIVSASPSTGPLSGGTHVSLAGSHYVDAQTITVRIFGSEKVGDKEKSFCKTVSGRYSPPNVTAVGDAKDSAATAQPPVKTKPAAPSEKKANASKSQKASVHDSNGNDTGTVTFVTPSLLKEVSGSCEAAIELSFNNQQFVLSDQRFRFVAETKSSVAKKPK